MDRDLKKVTPARMWFSTAEVSLITGRSAYALRDWARGRLVPAHLLCETPGGYLWHRDFLARPQPLRVRAAEAETV